MSILKVRNPVADSIEQKIDPAHRPSDLNGKRVGLYWNMKAGGDIALGRAQELLQKRYPTARFTEYIGSVGHVMRHCTSADADRIAKEADVVVGTSSD